MGNLQAYAYGLNKKLIHLKMLFKGLPNECLKGKETSDHFAGVVRNLKASTQLEIKLLLGF